MYHGDNLRVSSHIFPLIINLFSGWFGRKHKPFKMIHKAFLFTVKSLLIVIFSPVLLFRIIFPLDKRWKLRKRRMIKNNKVANLLDEVRGK